jgi:hypothetical protein
VNHIRRFEQVTIARFAAAGHKKGVAFTENHPTGEEILSPALEVCAGKDADFARTTQARGLIALAANNRNREAP